MMMDSITGSHHQMIMNKTRNILARPQLLEAKANDKDDELGEADREVRNQMMMKRWGMKMATLKDLVWMLQDNWL